MECIFDEEFYPMPNRQHSCNIKFIVVNVKSNLNYL